MAEGQPPGMQSELPPLWRDPRLAPVRADLAARAYAALASGRRLVDADPREVVAGSAAILASPSPDALQLTQAIFGERFDVYDEQAGWAWGQLATDRYVGWMRAGALAAPGGAPTHWVSASRTLLFSRADLKSRPLAHLPMNARVEVVGRAGRFAETRRGGFVFDGHLSSLGVWEADFVAVAQRFLGAPYLWGGRETAGVDCSGLIQASLMATGKSVLRDSDMQEATLGAVLAGANPRGDLRRGDLLFWPGHVGVMVDAERLLHANAWHMCTEIEPAGEALDRIEAAVGPVRSIRRMV